MFFCINIYLTKITGIIKMTLDTNIAKQQANLKGFREYSTAYVATNEDLRRSMKYVPTKTKNALVVAASGDHPIFTAMHGAKNVDTFDISYNAKLIMDIKTAALQILNHKEYCQLLSDLYDSYDITAVDNMPKIIEQLSEEEQWYIDNMREKPLFRHGALIKKQLPTATEFDKMRSVVNKPFNFIWSDIENLHTKLYKSYDFIHFSNIFDYKSGPQAVKIFKSLIDFIRPGCTICIENLFWSAKETREEFHNFVRKNIKNWRIRDIANEQTKSFETLVIHRIR